MKEKGRLGLAEALWDAVAEDDFELVKHHVEKARRLGLYCDLDASAWEGGWRSAPLHMAAWRGNNAIIRLLIEEAGANVNCLVLHHPSAPEKSDRETPLHVAARRGRADAVALLLIFGADPKLMGGFTLMGPPHACWGTPYDFARQRGRLECLKAFQAQGVIS